MASTTVSLSMVSLKTEGLSNTQAATGIMTSAVQDNIASLALMVILIPFAIGEATFSAHSLLLIAGKALGFFLLVSFMGIWLLPVNAGWVVRVPILRHINLKLMIAMGRGEYSILALLLIAPLMGLLADYFGFHPAIGAYMAGLIIKREYFDYHREQNIDFHH